MKALITGANGMLGFDLCPILKDKGFLVYPTDKTDEGNVKFMDICDFENVTSVFKEAKPEIVFHLAAETNVDFCEENPDHAYSVNSIGTQNMALMCQKYDIPLAYVSTCGIFDGKKSSPYTEYDTPGPVSIYSKSKYAGEKTVTELLNKFFIFRAGWMIGGYEKDKKFVAKIVELLKTKKELTVVNDKFGCPTFTTDFSKCIVDVALSNRFGTYHVTNQGGCSRYDIAKKIVEILGKKDVSIKPVLSDMFPLPAPRPKSEVAVNYNLKLIGMDTMPSWEVSFEKYILGIDAEKK